MITAKRAEEIINKSKNQNVLACGDIMLDAYLNGSVERFSQEAPVPIIPVTEEKFFPGGAGNAAACMATIKIKTHLFSVVGKKERISYSNILKEECKKNKIIPHLITDPKRKTTLKLRLTAKKTTSQHIARVDMEDVFPLDKNIEKKLISAIKMNFTKIRPLVISIHDYKKGFLTKNIFTFLMKLSKNKKIPVFADLKQDTFMRYRKLIQAPDLFFLKPNRNESVETAKLISGFDKNGNTDEEIAEIAKIIQKEVPIHIIITRGKNGAVLFEKNRNPFFVHIKSVEEQFDVAGAGDTIEAFLIAAYLGGATMSEALEIAVAASQVAIRKFGTSVVNKKELIDWIKKDD
jgi:D-beta-D-heptose 7-phosphate kinase / D-beta-D-heptose 1-phosphate adenosyltransferase